MKLNYKQRIFLYFSLVLVVFAAGIVWFEQRREKAYKTEILESDQHIYATLVHKYMIESDIRPDNIEQINKILPLLPENIRLTIVLNDGTVLYDNDVSDPARMENHRNRPEIKKALVKPFGSNIRKSSSIDNKEFMYYAVHYNDYFVRVALPYDIQVKNFFKPDNIFLYFIAFMFLAVLVAMFIISNRFGKSIEQLKSFVDSAQKGDHQLSNLQFPEDELGAIGVKIVDLYKQVKENKKKIAQAQEKMLQHFQSSEEGICFFSDRGEKIYANSHYIQFLNILIDKPTLSVNAVFEDPAFKEIQQYLNISHPESPVFSTTISGNSKHFLVRAIRFEDDSFEITIKDVTKSEKTRLMKQEMTNNIAHDLRTPVTSIRGYMETLLNQPDIDAEKRRFFIERSYSQILRLSDLIQDISLITRMEEASDLFETEKVAIRPLLDELQHDLSGKLEENQINLEIQVSDRVEIQGNRTLLYSIFRNLMDNSIAYGGNNISIRIHSYMEDTRYYYFTYSDTGVGVEERHLSRLFERFYRVSEGRTRDSGGSGLGLSIVKNAVLFHKGEIVAKNRKGGGLEFVFTLKKHIREN